MKKVKRKKRKSSTKSKGSCLIISPFGDYFDEYNDLIYKPAIEKAGLDAVRADDLYKTGSIVNDIWELTKNARILLADLSGKNPNVFYELGLAHAIAKPVVLITDNIQDVPFDLRTLRVIPYDKHEADWAQDLRESVTVAINDTLAQPGASILATFLQSQSARPKKISSEKKKLLELRQEVDSLKYQLVSVDRQKRRSMDLEEIEYRLRNFRSRKYPISRAMDRLISMGASPGSVEFVMRKMKW